MRKLVVTLTAASALVLGSALVVSANPFSLGASSPDHSSIKKVGCSRGSSNDTCPYGFKPRGHGPKKLMQAIQPARMPKFSAVLELLWEQCPRRLTALDAG